jgi:hypothetical protein
LYRDLLSARRQRPALKDFENRTARVTAGPKGGFLLEVVRGTAGADSLRILFNLGDQPVEPPEPPLPGSQVIFSSESLVYGGGRLSEEGVVSLLPWECVMLC